MREMIQMVVVLTVLSFVSGGLLAYVKDGTKDKIEVQQLISSRARPSRPS